MASIVYILCSLTSLACTVLLLRGYYRSRTPLLLWSSVCFVFLTLNNLLLVVDVVVVPDIDLSLERALPALLAALLLTFGLVRESR